MNETATNPLPYSLRLTGPRIVWALLLLGGVGWGLRCYAQQLMEGDLATGMRAIGSGGVGWGIYITFDLVFIGISLAGMVVAALTRIFDIESLRPLSRMATLLTIVSLLLGACTVLADLGSPLHGLLNLPRYARTTSPFFGTFTMVIGGYMFASLVYLHLTTRPDAALMAQTAPRFRWAYRWWASGYHDTPEQRARHYANSFWLALFILPMMLAAHSTLGFIFGIQGGRPGWFSTLQAPAFLAAAGASGIGVLTLVAALVRRAYRLEHVIEDRAFRWLGTFLWVLVVVVLYFIVAEQLTASYAANETERKVVQAITRGPYQTLFFVEVACYVLALIILFSQFAMRVTSVFWTGIGGFLVIQGTILKRYLLVVPSQTHGMLLPWPDGSYSPSWVEYGVLGGLLCLGALAYSVVSWVFPLIPVRNGYERLPRPHEPGRRAVAYLTLAVGFSLAAVGFAVSARFGTVPWRDPLFPFSPVLFIVGVMLLFGSAAVYELLPSRKANP